MPKGKREQVWLDCSEEPGSSRYRASYNPKKQVSGGERKKVQAKKYNKKLKKHTLHVEKKLK